MNASVKRATVFSEISVIFDEDYLTAEQVIRVPPAYVPNKPCLPTLACAPTGSRWTDRLRARCRHQSEVETARVARTRVQGGARRSLPRVHRERPTTSKIGKAAFRWSCRCRYCPDRKPSNDAEIASPRRRGGMQRTFAERHATCTRRRRYPFVGTVWKKGAVLADDSGLF